MSLWTGDKLKDNTKRTHYRQVHVYVNVQRLECGDLYDILGRILSHIKRQYVQPTVILALVSFGIDADYENTPDYSFKLLYTVRASHVTRKVIQVIADEKR